MADIDIDPFGEHESRTDEPMDEHIPLDPVTPGRSSTCEPDRGEQETSFRGEFQRTKLMKDYVKDLYKKLSENIGETQNYFTMIISNSKVENCTTEAPLDPVTPVGGGSTWEPTREQETSFRGESQRTKLMKDYVSDLYKSYQKTLVKPQKNFTMTILNLKMENCTTEAVENP